MFNVFKILDIKKIDRIISVPIDTLWIIAHIIKNQMKRIMK